MRQEEEKSEETGQKNQEEEPTYRFEGNETQMIEEEMLVSQEVEIGMDIVEMTGELERKEEEDINENAT